jgi:PPK2 family polyphosphate:nucleotide phosphotransferase
MLSVTESIAKRPFAVTWKSSLPERVITPDNEPDFYRMLIVEPGSQVTIGSIDPDRLTSYHSYEASAALLRSYVQKIDRMQYVMHAEKKHSLLIVLQGLDAGGKDGAVRHILTSLNPAGCRVAAFKQPTKTEVAHDFLWRVHAHAPARGEVAIFNRSHYEDVLVARVHRLVPPDIWSQRFGLINEFERLLAVANETVILKFFLHISKEEQLARFKRRLEDPTRRWKISDADYQEREHWDEYMAAFEDVLRKTSTRHAPWFVIPANDKPMRDMAISQIIVRTLEDLNMQLPETEIDIARIRRKYHSAEAESTSKAS